MSELHDQVRRRSSRKWLRRLVAGAAGLLIAVLLVYSWAWLSVDRSTIARAMVWMDSDVADQFRFPARRIAAGDRVSPLPPGREIDLRAPQAQLAGEERTFDDFLCENQTRAFVIVHQDRVVYERYFAGSDRQTLQTSFSMAKSFVSTLLGIALDEGLIGSVEDPVTKYIPELRARDPRFERITLRHLLTMSSGLRYSETGAPAGITSDATYTYYGVDLRDVALNRSGIERPPGETWHYNNYHPLLVGLVLERVTGMTVSNYMAARLWQPLGPEHDATWNYDSVRSGFEKMESGLNATAADYARFGLLFLHRGQWNGRRIVSEEWVRAATSGRTVTVGRSPYGYFWWVDSERPKRFFALGRYGQYIYVAPDAGAVIVRTGSGWGPGNRAWLAMFRDIADRLAKSP